MELGNRKKVCVFELFLFKYDQRIFELPESMDKIDRVRFVNDRECI